MRRRNKIGLIVLLIPALLIVTLYLLLQIKLKGIEQDMRVYLMDRGVAESEIVSIEAKRSILPTYPVFVHFAHDPKESYLFKPDELNDGLFILIGSELPPPLIDHEAVYAPHVAFLEAYGFTKVDRAGMTDSSILTADAPIFKLLQTYRSVPDADPSALYGQRVNTFKYSVDAPTLRPLLDLQPDDRIDAYVLVIGDLVRGGYVEVNAVRYTLKGELVQE